MDITNKYVLFHPNYLATKREQIRLQKLIRLNSDEIKSHLFKPNKLKVWRVEKKTKKKYIPQESKYNLKQIVKNFKLNREQLSHGYSNKYINLFTNLLYEKNIKKYAQKRLSLVDFRKKILKKNLNTSFEEFIEKEPLSEKYNFSKRNLNNLYLTTLIQKLEKSKNKEKNNCLTSRKEKEKNKSNNKNNRILLKELFIEPNSSDYKLNIKNNNNDKLVKIFSYNDSGKKNNQNNENLINNNLFDSKIYDASISELNIHSNQNKIINNYIYAKDEDEYKYFGKLTPKEEFITGRNKAKYIDYLKNKYHFYTSNNIKDLKNYSEIKKRQLKFNSGKDKIEYVLDFPYKKEFFKRYNRINRKNNIKLLINENIKNSDIHNQNKYQKIRNNFETTKK